MEKYYIAVHPNANDEYEVHVRRCVYFPMSYRDLGMFQSCRDALIAASRHFTLRNGCPHCCPECHEPR